MRIAWLSMVFAASVLGLAACSDTNHQTDDRDNMNGEVQEVDVVVPENGEVDVNIEEQNMERNRDFFDNNNLQDNQQTSGEVKKSSQNFADEVREGAEDAWDTIEKKYEDLKEKVEDWFANEQEKQ